MPGKAHPNGIVTSSTQAAALFSRPNLEQHGSIASQNTAAMREMKLSRSTLLLARSTPASG